MALVKFGGGIVAMAGKMAGNVFARNRSGSYVRQWTKPVNPQSARQVAIRNILAFLAQEWKDTLTALQRGVWETYADAISMQNRLGESIKLSGFNHFIRSNSAIMTCGLSYVAAGPTELSLPETDPTFAIAATADDQQIAITFDDTEEWCDENEAAMEILVGTPQKVTVNFFNGPFRYGEAIEGDSVTPPSSGDEITSPFTLVESQIIFCEARIIRADGRISNRFRAPATAVAAS